MNLYNALKISWCLLAVVVLAITLAGYDGQPNSDIEQLLIGGMLVLSFPMGFVVAGLFSIAYAGLGSCCATTVTVSHASLLVEWLAFAVAGYIQWFVVLPWLRRKWQSRRAASSTSD